MRRRAPRRRCCANSRSGPRSSTACTRWRGCWDGPPCPWKRPSPAWCARCPRAGSIRRSAVPRSSTKGTTYRSSEFEPTPWVLSADIVVQHKNVGVVRVYYARQMPGADTGPFLKEEDRLIHTVADRLSHFVQHQELRRSLAGVPSRGAEAGGRAEGRVEGSRPPAARHRPRPLPAHRAPHGELPALERRRGGAGLPCGARVWTRTVRPARRMRPTTPAGAGIWTTASTSRTIPSR